MDLDVDLQNLVLERLKRQSSHLIISIGNVSYTNEELLSNVKDGTKLGWEIVKIHLNYMRAMAKYYVKRNA